jgi:hypothetical protein
MLAGIADKRGMPEFSKAKKFSGAWLGMVFKRGHLGVGYYRDEFVLNLKLMDHVSAAADAIPITISLDKIIPNGNTEATRTEDEPDTCPRRKRTSTGRKSKGEGLDMEWPSDDSLAANSTFHAMQGHWAFETVNGSCWNTASEYLTKSAADFVGIQESKILEGSIADTEQAARNKGWKTAISPCILTAAEGKSAGTAVCCRTHIGARRSFAEDCMDKAMQARFQMKHFGAVCRGGWGALGRVTSTATGTGIAQQTWISCRTSEPCWQP